MSCNARRVRSRSAQRQFRYEHHREPRFDDPPGETRSGPDEEEPLRAVSQGHQTALRLRHTLARVERRRHARIRRPDRSRAPPWEGCPRRASPADRTTAIRRARSCLAESRVTMGWPTRRSYAARREAGTCSTHAAAGKPAGLSHLDALLSKSSLVTPRPATPAMNRRRLSAREAPCSTRPWICAAATSARCSESRRASRSPSRRAPKKPATVSPTINATGAICRGRTPRPLEEPSNFCSLGCRVR